MSDVTNVKYEKMMLKTVSKLLQDKFSLKEGLILGDSAVVSKWAHLEPRKLNGTVFIYNDSDAGMTYLNQNERDLVVHIQIFHQPAAVNLSDLAVRVRLSLFDYIDLTENAGTTAENPQSFTREKAALGLAKNIFLKTAGGECNVLNPAPGSTLTKSSVSNHLHILALVPAKDYGLVHILLEQAIKALASQGVKLRNIKELINISENEAVGSLS